MYFMILIDRIYQSVTLHTWLQRAGNKALLTIICFNDYDAVLEKKLAIAVTILICRYE